MTLLKPEQIKINYPASDWEDAVRAAGEILVQNGFAEKRYIQGMINLAKELGPYIVIAPGIAIPHARPEEGAIEVGFAAMTLATPINFGNEDNDPVFLVLAFCSPGANAHVELLTKIARILAEEGFMEKVKSAKTAEELVDAFNFYEERILGVKD
jgi:mannitol/fructose-specific phosphotransferase system IIA component (Ntr-type)